MQRFNVKITDAKLWKNEHQGRNGTFYTYSISVSKKMQDGSFKNKGMKVYVQKGVPKEVPNGALCDIDGFMTLDVFNGRDGEVVNPMVFATEVKFADYEAQQESYDSFEELDEDVPF